MNLDNWIFITVIKAPLKKQIPRSKTYRCTNENSVRKICLIFIKITFKNILMVLNIPFSFFKQNMIYFLWFWGPGFVRFTPTWMKFHLSSSNIRLSDLIKLWHVLEHKKQETQNQWYLLKTSHWNVINRKLVKRLRCDSDRIWIREAVMNTLVLVLVILELLWVTHRSSVNKFTYTDNASNNTEFTKACKWMRKKKIMKLITNMSSSSKQKWCIYFKPLRLLALTFRRQLSTFWFQFVIIIVLQQKNSLL